MHPAVRPLTGALALALAVLAAGPAHALDDPALRTRVTTLSNGLTVLTLEDDTTPVVSFQAWVRVGSRDEARYTGLAHLFEHMMFRGTKHLPPEAHGQLVQARGGRVNAYTSRDVTVYFEDVPAEALPLVIDLEAERFANLRITADTLESEREVVLEERRMRTETSPSGLGFERLLALAFLAHPYRRPVIGWRSDVEAATVKACREFFDTYYAPNNVVVVIVGDFDAAAALERIERRFGGLEPAAEIPRNPTREPEQRGERRGQVTFEVAAPLVGVAWHAPATGHPDAEALDVASQILSGGRSSRLYQRLVYRDALALGAQGAYWELLDAGIFYGFVNVRPGRTAEEAEAALFEEVGRLASAPPGEAEVAKARRQLEVSLINGLATTHALANRIGSDWVMLGRIRPLEERRAAIRRVTPADVQRVMGEYLVDSRRTVVRVVPPDAVAPPEGAGAARAGAAP